VAKTYCPICTAQADWICEGCLHCEYCCKCLEGKQERELHHRSSREGVRYLMRLRTKQAQYDLIEKAQQVQE